MVAQRQPVDRVIDLVVGLPVATAVAARRTLPLIRQASRQGARTVARRARKTLGATSEEAFGDPAPDATALPWAARARAVGGAADEAPEAAPPEVARAAVLPIDDYDHLAARQVVDRLATLTDAELVLVDRYERAHRHRQTVLGRIAQLQT